MIIEKMSKLEGDLGRSDIRTYIDENLLQVSKKLDQKYSEVKEQLVRQEMKFEKEKDTLEVKIERLSNETNDHKKVENTLDSSFFMFRPNSVQFFVCSGRSLAKLRP